MAHSFRVDAVEPAATALPTLPLGACHPGALHVEPARDTPVVALDGMPVLLGAVHLAFAQHRPLVLSPDVVWLTIAQGVALHLGLHADALRGRLGRPDGRRSLTLPWDGPAPGADDAAWREVVAGFRALLSAEIGEGRARLLTCDYSTTTDVEAAASEVVLLDAFARYFDYGMTCVCGIPEVTVRGTPDDYRKMAAKLAVLRELDLGFWVDSLDPIVAELGRACAGAPTVTLWQAMYKPRQAYGADLVTGWIGRLYPYCGADGRYEQRNPLLALSHKALMRAALGADSAWYTGPGVAAHQLPSAVSSVLVHLTDLDGARADLLLEGGPLYVGQDADGRLEPRAGFVVRRASHSTAAVIARIRASHACAPADPAELPRYQGRADLGALYDAFAQATLFDGRVVLLPHAQHRPVQLADGVVVTCVADAGEWALAEQGYGEQRTVVRLRRAAVATERSLWERFEALTFGERRSVLRPSTERSRDVAVVGGSMTEVLTYALDHNGALPPARGPLWDALPEWARREAGR